jgi:large subunit ribosomal protein L6
MSRVAKNPVVIPAGVEVKIDAGQIVVKGRWAGSAVHPSVKVEHGEAGVQCSAIEGAVNGNAMSGTLRALVNNMVTGVSKGFERKLNLVGVGYRAQAQGDKLNLPRFLAPGCPPDACGIKVETPTQTEIVIKGVDKQAVGKVAAEVRAYRAPEPYKGKGVRYSDEVVTLKETKKK